MCLYVYGANILWDSFPSMFRVGLDFPYYEQCFNLKAFIWINCWVCEYWLAYPFFVCLAKKSVWSYIYIYINHCSKSNFHIFSDQKKKKKFQFPHACLDRNKYIHVNMHAGFWDLWHVDKPPCVVYSSGGFHYGRVPNSEVKSNK